MCANYSGSDGDVSNPLRKTLNADNNDLTNVGALSAGSVNTESVNDAKQISHHSSVQAAFDAAGQHGTVVFDAKGGPYTLDSTPSLYNGQTIILRADINGNNGTLSGAVFDFSGLTGTVLVPNGHTIDGQDRTGSVSTGVLMPSGATECHIEGVLKVKRVSNLGVKFEGEKCSADTVVAVDCGDFASNDASGDGVYLSNDTSNGRNTVERVIGQGVARHTVGFAGSGGGEASETVVETVISTDPGGGHVWFEAAQDCRVGSIIGTGARQATTKASPASTYAGSPVIAFNAASGTDTSGVHVGYINTSAPAGGSGPDLGFANGCSNNNVGHFRSLNSAGYGITFGTGAADAPDNTVAYIEIDGASGPGVQWSNGPNCKAGTDGGVVKNCSGHGVEFGSPPSSGDSRGMKIGPVEVFDNCTGSQSLTAAAGVAISNSNITKGVTVEGTTIRDGSGGTQDTGFADANVSNSAHLKGIDVTNAATAYSINDVSNYAASNNRPSIDRDKSVSPGFDSWTTAQPDLGVLITVNAEVVTDGTNVANARIEVDKSGGTTGDYEAQIVKQPATSDGDATRSTATVYVPPGGQYQVVNGSDPKGNNTIIESRQVIIG